MTAPGTSAAKNALVNLSLFAASCLFALGALEIFFRLFLPQDLIYPMAARLDREIIYTLTPDFESRLKGTSPRMFTLKTNSLGLREREPGPKAAPRLLLLGDSMSMAEGAEYEELYIKKLEKLLNSGGRRPAETVNAAIRGYGNDQQLILMRRVAPAYRPDAVLLAFFTGNDLDDNRDGALFRLTPDGSLEQRPAAPETSRKFRYYSVQARAQAVPGYNFVMRRFHFANWVRVSVARILQRRVYAPAPQAAAAKPLPLRDREDYRLTEAILRQWRSEVAGLGARPYLMIIPKREDALAMRAGTYAGERLDLAIEAFCRREGIPCLNLTPKMLAMKEGFEELWLSCGHFSPAGHEWTAARLFEDLPGRSLLPLEQGSPL